MKEFNGISLEEEKIYCCDESARASAISIGKNFSVYVSSGGSDTNNGLSPDNAVLTWKRVKEIMKRCVDKDGNVVDVGQFTVYLCDGVNLQISDGIISQGAPHIIPYDDSIPTLTFTYNPVGVTTGPRFYSGRVHLGDSSGKKMYIRSSIGSLYFENCAVGLYNLLITCPINITGGSISSNNCTFTRGSVEPWWNNTACVTTLYCRGNFRGITTFNALSSDTIGIYAQQRSDIRVYGTINTSIVSTLVSLDHSTLDITSLTIEGVSAVSNIVNTTQGCTVLTSNAILDSYRDKITISDNSILYSGKNYITTFGSTKNNSISLGSIIVPGYVSEGNLYFYVDLGSRKTNFTDNKATCNGEYVIYGVQTSYTTFSNVNSVVSSSYGDIFAIPVDNVPTGTYSVRLKSFNVTVL